MLDFSRCRLPPFQHQREDVEWLMDQPFAFIASEMRTGKSKIIVDTAQMLFERDIIDKVIIVAPAPVRGHVWADSRFGQIAEHLWRDIHARVTEFHERLKVWRHGPEDKPRLDFFVTNYEFLRSRMRVEQLLPACGRKTFLVLDESSFVKNHKAQQTKACVQLRKRCGRVVLLNGTPIFHSPLDLFSQGNLLHPSILDCHYISHFKARYAIESPVLERGKPMVRYGKIVKQVDGWSNLDDLERRFAPYTVRRLQAECLDLPPKLDPVTLTATLTDDEWRAYRNMRDEMLVWLQNGRVVTSSTAAIKALRLSQITSGFLSGVEDALSGAQDALSGAQDANIGKNDSNDFEWDLMEDTHGDAAQGDGQHSPRRRVQPTGGRQDLVDPTPRNQQTDIVNDEEHRCTIAGGSRKESSRGDDVEIEGKIAIGRAKLDVLLWFIERQLERDQCMKLVTWSRFRAEAIRAHDEVKKKYPHIECALLLGEQKRDERTRALELLKPETAPHGPVFIAGIEGTGSFGLDMTASHTCVTLSGGYSSGKSLQTLDRVYGPGQQHPISYYNVIATGPKGQRTIDYDILTARTNGENIAMRTAAAWVKALGED